MFLAILFAIILISIITIPKIIKKNRINKKIVVFTSIIILLGAVFGNLKMSSNDVLKEDRVALENYILDKYDLKLKVKKSTIICRGEIGFFPGIEYSFVLQNSMGQRYYLNINEYEVIDLKSILLKNPELEIKRTAPALLGE